MSLEAEACYRRLLDFQWMDGSIPNPKSGNTFPLLCRMLKNIRVQKLRRLWIEIEPCFDVVEGGERLVNPQLERIRREAIELRRERSRAGKASAQSNKERTLVQQVFNKPPANRQPPTPTPTPTPKKKPPPTPQKGGDGRFDEFWQAYPRREAKAAARRAWTRVAADSHLEQILPWLARARLSEQWQDASKIPHPATFLNQERWRDDPPPPPRRRNLDGEAVTADVADQGPHTHHCGYCLDPHEWHCSDFGCSVPGEAACSSYARALTARALAASEARTGS